MRFLMAAMKYPTGPGESYLTTELANALVEAGHEVQVLHLDWDSYESGPAIQTVTANGVRVLRVPAQRVPGLRGALGHAGKFLMTGCAAANAAQCKLDLASFDALIGWMPAIAIGPLLPLVRRAGIAHRHLFIWDFFPDHYHQIGRIPGGSPLWLAHRLEQHLLRSFTTIFCTLPANAAYLRETFEIAEDQRVEIAPIWTTLEPEITVDRVAERERHGLPPGNPIAVFGGQMSAGRGFDQILAAAREALDAGSSLHFLLIGDGPLAAEIAGRAASLPNVHCHPGIARADYRRLIAACDVGLAATVAGVSSFSFPSKILDYLGAGLPVVASLEPGNDACTILERFGVGTAVPLGDARNLFLAGERLATDLNARVRAVEGGRRCLAEVFDVHHTVSALVRATMETKPLRRAPVRTSAASSA